jgi:hypothetical protein
VDLNGGQRAFGRYLMRRHPRSISLLLVVLIAFGASCSSAKDPVAAETAPTQTEIPPPTDTASVAEETTLPEETQSSAILMPDVVCMNLQKAQDTIQEAGVFFSRSFDATGRGRRQILDRNWIVVSQTPDAGEPIEEGDAKLGAVKKGEPNPC